MEFDNKLNNLRNYISYFLNQKERQYSWHLRIIVDKEIPFPRNLSLVKYDNDIDVTKNKWHENSRYGWNKPDKVFSGVELRYILKDIKIFSFEDWLNNGMPKDAAEQYKFIRDNKK